MRGCDRCEIVGVKLVVHDGWHYCGKCWASICQATARLSERALVAR